MTRAQLCMWAPTILWPHAGIWPRESWVLTHTYGHPQSSMPNVIWTPTHIVCGHPTTAMLRTPMLCSGWPRHFWTPTRDGFMGTHMIIRTTTRFWATTCICVRPRDIMGAQTICEDSHARGLMGAHGYWWRATRLMWVPTRIYAPPQPVLGDHYRGGPLHICGQPRIFVSCHAMYWATTRCYGHPRINLDAHVICCG